MEQIGALVVFTDFNEWKEKADKAGWVHIHDDFVVCDAGDYCVGEFGESAGWLLKEYCD